jgi:putative DNA primase/helicase
MNKKSLQHKSVQRRKAFIEIASWIPDLNVKTDSLDPNLWLLNVESGTVDLRTDEYRGGKWT